MNDVTSSSDLFKHRSQRAKLRALPLSARVAAMHYKGNESRLPVWTFWFYSGFSFFMILLFAWKPSWPVGYVASVTVFGALLQWERLGVRHLLNLSREELDRLGIKQIQKTANEVDHEL